MCGIVGAVAKRDVVPLLIDGIKRLEYRGYDSAGVAAIGADGKIKRARTVGKVQNLVDRLEQEPITANIGIAHTRWATHGAPVEENAHPHLSSSVAMIHNGIIENHDEIRSQLIAKGYTFHSETDSEVIVHLVEEKLKTHKDLFKAVEQAAAELRGAYSFAVFSTDYPDCVVIAREGCPAVVGKGDGENFVASDVAALLPVTREYMVLEDGDVARVDLNSIQILDRDRKPVERKTRTSSLSLDAVEKGNYAHFMLKEIYEQPRAIAETLSERLHGGKIMPNILGPQATELLKRIKHVQIVACGTSYHAGLVAAYQIEKLCRIPCRVEIASEFRYRNPVVPEDALFISISQSGETADTLAAVKLAKEEGYLARLAVCNVPESSLVRESDLVLMTRAGPEIGVASTKAFTTQLAAMGIVALSIAHARGMDPELESRLVHELLAVPALMTEVLKLDPEIKELAKEFADKQHALFLGRGENYPIAMEGALKLKEISYIHAESYAAGELKHGPLALVDADMPVIAVAPNDTLLEKLRSNLREVRARGGELFVFADQNAEISDEEHVHLVRLPVVATKFQQPILHTVPLQLLSYYVALIKGTNVDQPRNLAKSVTVE